MTRDQRIKLAVDTANEIAAAAIENAISKSPGITLSRLLQRVDHAVAVYCAHARWYGPHGEELT